MSVNLNKQGEQGHKVSLQKEELKKGGKISLKKEALPKTDGTVDFGPDGVSGSVGGGIQNTSAGSAGGDRNKRLLLWIGLPIAAAVVLLLAGLSARNSSTKAGSEIPSVAINDSTESKAGKNQWNGNEKSEIDDDDNMTENFQNQEEAEANDETADEEPSAAAADSNQRADDASIHNYEIIVADVTWSEAFADCVARGGYLCRINSAEENEKIKELLNKQNAKKVVYLGGMREENSKEYHWVDENKEPYDDVINDGEYKQFWYDGEPSYVDHVADQEITEKYMAFIYPDSTKKWVWNDVSDDVLSLAPKYYSGKLSYICEYEK